MDRQIIPLGAIRAGLFSGLVIALLALLGAPSYAAKPSPSPSAPVVKSVQITGVDLADPIVVTSTDNESLYRALASEVTWMAGNSNYYTKAGTKNLGPKYTLVLSINGKAKQKYDLYPLAEGGARAFRPAAQPEKKKVAEGWFYANLSMPYTLRDAGVPLRDVPPPHPGAGGRGGGAGSSTDGPAETDIQGLVGDWQRFVGLNFGVVLVIGFGLFVIAFLVRRRA